MTLKKDNFYKVRDLVQTYIHDNPSEFEFWKWDGWDYEIYGPRSMDDLAVVDVVLINQSDTNLTITFELVEKNELEELRKKVRDMK